MENDSEEKILEDWNKLWHKFWGETKEGEFSLMIFHNLSSLYKFLLFHAKTQGKKDRFNDHKNIFDSIKQKINDPNEQKNTITARKKELKKLTSRYLEFLNRIKKFKKKKLH